MDLNERDIYTDSIVRSFQRQSEQMKAKQSRTCQCIESGKVQTIVRRLSQGSCTSKQSGDLSPEDLECLENANRLRNDLSNDEVSLLRRQNAELCQELQHYKAKLAEMEKCMCEIEQQRKSNNCLEKEVVQLGCSKAKEMENLKSCYKTAADKKDNELSKIKKLLCEAKVKIQELKKKLCKSNKELEVLRPLRDRCCELKNKLECAGKDAVALNEKLMKECAKYQADAAGMTKLINNLKVESKEQLKCSEGLAEQLRNCRNVPKPEKSEDESSKRAFLLKCIQALKQNYCDMKADNIDKINCYENKIRVLKAEIETLRCSSKRIAPGKSSQCDWNANDCGDILLRNIAKFGIESLQRDDLIDLHNRVRCAMMNAKQLAKVDERNSPDYYSKLANDLCIKYDLKDSLPAYTDLDKFPMKDLDMSSCKTMPALRSPRSKSANVISKKERARSTDTARCDKRGRRVTIGRAIKK